MLEGVHLAILFYPQFEKVSQDVINTTVDHLKDEFDFSSDESADENPKTPRERPALPDLELPPDPVTGQPVSSSDPSSVAIAKKELDLLLSSEYLNEFPHTDDRRDEIFTNVRSQISSYLSKDPFQGKSIRKILETALYKIYPT